jgi:hypothetical protein
MRTCAANAPRTAEPQLWPACMNGCEEASSRDDCAGSLPGEVERDGSRRSRIVLVLVLGTDKYWQLVLQNYIPDPVKELQDSTSTSASTDKYWQLVLQNYIPDPVKELQDSTSSTSASTDKYWQLVLQNYIPDPVK